MEAIGPLVVRTGKALNMTGGFGTDAGSTMATYVEECAEVSGGVSQQYHRLSVDLVREEVPWVRHSRHVSGKQPVPTKNALHLEFKNPGVRVERTLQRPSGAIRI